MKAPDITPEELDAAIAKNYPDASVEARATIKAKVEKRYKRQLDQYEHRNRPSLLNAFENSPHLWHLSALRETVQLGLAGGQIQADRRTVEKWEDAMWSRLIFFFMCAPTIDEATWVINHTITWNKPQRIVDLINKIKPVKYASL